jgi:transcriptional regulator with XRE-family HTH domain
MKKKADSKVVKFPEYNLGERIKFLRNSRGLSQAQLAAVAKVSQPTITQIESGKKDPSVQTLMNIATALDVETAALFTSEDIFVFDLKRLRRKYNHRDKLTPHLYMALGKVVQYAKDIEFL